jgi:Fur family transcriptional regulator, iron response regulator
MTIRSYVFRNEEQPSADKVWAVVGETFPAISRATVYNTLNVFVEKGLLSELHFIDGAAGQVHDIPWDEVEVSNNKPLPDFEVIEYQAGVGLRRHSP